MARKILHLADVHLDTPFASSGLPSAIGAQRRQALCEALERALSLARSHQVDAVTIAGDLVDGGYALPETGALLSRAFAALDPIPVVVEPGRADPWADDSLYALMRWPGNVAVLPPGPLAAVQVAPDLHVWGAAWSADKPPALSEVSPSAQGTHLLLWHGGATAPDDDGPPAEGALSPQAVRDAGFAYALLGGRHVGGPWPDGDPCGCYPGSIEPLALGEMMGRHGAALVSIGDDGACTAAWLNVGRGRYVALHADLNGCATPAEAARRIEAALARDRARSDPHAIATVTLTGAPAQPLALAEVRARIDARAHVVIQRAPASPYDLDLLAAENTVRGLLVRRFLSSLDAEARGKGDHWRQAIDLALRALDGRGVRPGEVS